MTILGSPANQKQAFLVNKLSKSLGSAVEPVPNPMNSLNIGWIRGYILQFLPQIGNVAVHCPGVQIPAVSPDTGQHFGAADHAAAIFSHVPENVEFARRKLDRASALGRGETAEIQFHITESVHVQHSCAASPAGAAQHRF